jgi:hypothetical protein
MLFNPRYGRVGLVGFCNMLITDIIGPPVEVLGYLLVPLLWALGLISWDYVLAFAALTFIYGIFLSISALILEELELRRFPKTGHLLRLTSAAILENFGFRQFNTLLRVIGHWQFLRGASGWGRITRAGFQAN